MLDVLGTYCIKNSASFSHLHGKPVCKGSAFLPPFDITTAVTPVEGAEPLLK